MVHETINGHGHEVTVTVTSASTVAPALPVQEHRLALSNLDLILPPMDVGVFFCYAGEGSGGGAALPAILKAALAKVLVAYYPLAGEVVANARGEGELLCSGRGVDFAEASAGDAELRELRLAVVDESAKKLVPKKKAGVMCVQVTKFKCGGAVVGCTFEHRVCDAYSFNMFLVAWAAAARGSAAAPAPSFDRSFLAPSSPAPPCPDALSDRLFVPVSCVPVPSAATKAAAAVNRIFRVAAGDVAALQAAAGPGRTKLEAFTAHLWQLHAKVPSPRHRRSCCMGVVVDGRTRLRRDGAMKSYFGNVLTIPYGAMSSGDLSGMALADVADDVHRWVMEAATCDHFRGLIDWVEQLRPEPSVARAYLGGDDGAEAAACVVSSGMRMPVGEVDFGWGRPAFASYHFPWPGGAGYVMPMPSARGDGDWVVYVHAAAEVVKAMEEEETTVFRALESNYVFGQVHE